uniref:Major capsid protein N-terminal domain-containing protein n=1 Tax=viral metagenome TaxID=1070528 RepID=A0A6C0C9S3_9ZZZZ
MPGGIIQLAVYGTQDIFLTGTPQITFFKTVYRRYTNFAVESLQQFFVGDPNFGFDITCVVDKLGDLMHKVYLEIIIPEVNLSKNPSQYVIDQNIAQQEFIAVQDYYDLVVDYNSVDTDVIRKLSLMLRTNNLPMSEIEKIMNDPLFIDKLRIKRENLRQYILTSDTFNRIPVLRDLKLPLYYQINRFDMQILFNSVICNIDKYGGNMSPELRDVAKRRALIRIITKSIYPELQEFYLVAYNLFIEKEQVYRSFLNGTYVERYKFAWVEELGHAIIETLDLKIGNQIIDRHTGDWMILYNNVSINEYQKRNYEKMIGQVPKLIVFDSEIKPEYKLVIPLQFYFCKYSGMSIPLVALRYHDVLINLRMKDLSQLCYVEDDPGLLDIPNIQALYGINIIDAKLYVDYVFLDSDERRRFAQSTHEYLIETIQYNEFPDVLGKQYSAHLTFSQPCKYVIWFCQPNQYRGNPTGRNKCQWNNFGVNPDKTGYTLMAAFLRLNTYERTDTGQSIIFFNFVQPYMYFRHSPPDGEYVYSFGTIPLEHQPSSTCNMSRIDDFGIIMEFTPEFLQVVAENTVNSVGIYIAAYVVSYNIIRIMSGMAGLAFQVST